MCLFSLKNFTTVLDLQSFLLSLSFTATVPNFQTLRNLPLLKGQNVSCLGDLAISCSPSLSQAVFGWELSPLIKSWRGFFQFSSLGCWQLKYKVPCTGCSLFFCPAPQLQKVLNQRVPQWVFPLFDLFPHLLLTYSPLAEITRTCLATWNSVWVKQTHSIPLKFLSFSWFLLIWSLQAFSSL